MEIQEIVSRQREYYFSGATLPVEKRIITLKKIKSLLYENRSEINKAFMDDYNKCEMDVTSTEFYMVIAEIDYLLKHIRKLAKPKKVRPSIANFPSKGFLINEPYGVVLIVSPWNYPLQLTLAPLVGAIAAGNTVVVKPSNYAKNVSAIMAKIFSAFDPSYISFVLGGREQNQLLFEQTFDYIFFTGGQVVGKLLMTKAAEHLTPVSLELGGKSPAIIDEDADLDLAARRLAWAKFLNAGQTCVAPDHFIVHEKVHDEFVRLLLKYIKEFFYVNGKLTHNFPYVINDKHVEMLQALIQPEKLIWGGKIPFGRALEPTVLDHATYQDPSMQEEIFGPILPILTFSSLEDLLNEQIRRPKPLAFYYFSKNIRKAKRVMGRMSYGGGCINQAIMHMTSDSMPFGGVGRSGMGSYHGEMSFRTFSHQKSVLVKKKAELKVLYPPYTEKKLNVIKLLAGIRK